MPPIKRTNIIRRRRRETIRQSVQNSRNNNVDVDVNEIQADNLVPNFKSALNAVPANFLSRNLGSMALICSSCGAKHFNSEVTDRNTCTFTLCSHKAKIKLPPLTCNDFIKNIIEGISLNDRVVKNRASNYFNNIRS